MYNIALCDDEQDFADEMKQYIQRYQEESGEEIRVMVFRNGLELIENYDPSTDLIFLDIQMDQMDGLETAKRIREKDEEAGIIFLTSLKQYALEGYQYQAVNYLIKPMKYIRLKTELDRWIEKCRKKNPCIVIANDQGTFKAAVNKIHYIETYKRNLLLHTDEGEVISYESMKALEQRLSPFGFYRCHAGYLVNMGLVRKVEKLEITLSSGETVYVSKPKKKDFMKALAGYWGEDAMMQIHFIVHILSIGVNALYSYLFFRIFMELLEIRKNILIKVTAYIAFVFLWTLPIYNYSSIQFVYAPTGMILFVALFFRGNWTKKIFAVLVFCPLMIAVNFITFNLSDSIYYRVTGDPGGLEWSVQELTAASLIALLIDVLRLLLTFAVYPFLKKYICRIKEVLTARMWIVLDILLLVPFAATFGILCFTATDVAVIYPICITVIASSFGYIYLVSYICRTMEVVHHAKEMEMLQKFYDERLKEEERVRAVYHDMKNHLLLLEARTGHQEETQEMIQRLQEKVEDYENYIQTGNAYLDIILRDKMRLAKESRIDVQAEVEFSKGKFIDGLDISTIFGNAWDNAMEACMKLPEEQRFITVRAGVRNQFLIVKFENSAKEGDLEIPTTKADTFMHGFGKKNIQKAVEKYQGSCQWDYTEGIYSLSILIPITEEK